MESTIRKLALINALKFKGKANPKALIGGLIVECPQVKQNMKEAMGLINKIVEQVNSMSLEDQQSELLSIDPEYLDKQSDLKQKRKEQRKQLPPLPEAVKGEVKTRIPPEPSKYNHVGHAVSFLINYLYAKMYEGKCVLRFEDTNPELATQEYVDAMIDDLTNYLDLKVDEIKYVSDNIGTYYAYALQLVQRDLAYCCFCSSENIRNNRRSMTDCECRDKENQESIWNDMLEGKYKDGEVVLRLKISMQHKNAVMRDPVIFRLCKTPHYRQKDKFRVWPLYDFENAIEEGLCKVTHVLRSNEFHSRIELQDHIRALLTLPKVITKQYGRMSIVGSTTKGREIRELIASGEYIGWDDPRLVTLRALKRRGIVKETFYELATQVGMSKTQTNLDYSLIAAINRRILDVQAKRLFLVEDPVKISIRGIPNDLSSVLLAYHPDHEKGQRTLELGSELFIENKDFASLKPGQTIRLMDAFNIEMVEGTSFKFVGESYEDYRKSSTKGSIIHYVPVSQEQKISVFMPDATTKECLVEHNVLKLNEGEVVQFERWGFCRLDKQSAQPLFWYSHP